MKKTHSKNIPFLSVLIVIILSASAFVKMRAQNLGFTSGQLLYSSQVSVRSGSKIVPTDVHVYYIGTNNKICEDLWNGTTWVGGGQLEWSWDFVQANTQIANNGNELFFIRNSDNRICRLAWNSTTGWVSAVLSATMIPARAGTDIIYENNVIYYVGNSSNSTFNNKVCYISRPNSSSAFNLNNVLSTNGSFDVTVNTQMIKTSSFSSHVYYVGAGNRIYDIVNANNAGIWTGSSGYLAAASPIPAIRSGAELNNNGDQLFYTGTDSKIYEVHWTSGPGWTGSCISPVGSQLVNLNTKWIKYFDNHIYFMGGYDSRIVDLFYNGTSWTGGLYDLVSTSTQVMANTDLTLFAGSTGHNIFYIGTDSRVNFLVWDDKICPFVGWDPAYCQYSSCAGQQWHWGRLNTTANNIVSTSKIALPSAPVKSFYFIDPSGRVNVFLRNVLNGISKPGWVLTRDDEFNSLATTQSLWDCESPWSHGMYNNNCTDPNKDLQYGNFWNNISVNGGVGTIQTKQQNISGYSFGWGVGPVPNMVFNGYMNYCYTNGILASGGINVGLSCTSGDQYCICGGTPPTCNSGYQPVSTCANYVPKYSGISAPDNNGTSFTTPKFYQKYGWYEIRCRVPRGKKMWSAFWAVNKGYYPDEIDFFEIEGNGKTMLSNIYYEGCTGSGNIAADNHLTYAVGYRYYDDFYTYACEWSPTSVKWFLNNELIATSAPGARVPQDEFWVIINNYVANNRAFCEPDIFPNNYDIDYIRIYQNPLWRVGQEHTEAPAQNMFDAITMFPNPSSNTITLAGIEEVLGSNVEVIDAMGRKCLAVNLTRPDQQVDVSGLSNGIYFLNIIQDGRKVKTLKLVKE